VPRPAGRRVAGVQDTAIRVRLERALREALRAHDTVVVSAVRSALAALDNAQAVLAAPATGPSSPHFAGAAAAREYERRGLAARASRLRREASALTSVMGPGDAPGEP